MFKKHLDPSGLPQLSGVMVKRKFGERRRGQKCTTISWCTFTGESPPPPDPHPYLKTTPKIRPTRIKTICIGLPKVTHQCCCFRIKTTSEVRPPQNQPFSHGWSLLWASTIPCPLYSDGDSVPWANS